MRKAVIPALVIVSAAAIIWIIGSRSTPDEVVEIRALAASLETRMHGAIDMMRSTSEDPEVRQTSALSLVSEAQMGIPGDADTGKRDIAKAILSEHGDVASIFFLTPDGNLYMGEPYEQQAQLPRLNYSDRDWYQGVSSTDDAYVSSVFMSAAIHEPAVAVAVPVHGEGSETIGYWVAIINLDEVERDLKKSVSGTRVIFADHNGVEVADSARGSTPRDELRSFSSLQSVKEALAGRSGSLVEEVDGKSATVYYAPLNAYPHTWAAVMVVE